MKIYDRAPTNWPRHAPHICRKRSSARTRVLENAVLCAHGEQREHDKANARGSRGAYRGKRRQSGNGLIGHGWLVIWEGSKTQEDRLDSCPSLRTLRSLRLCVEVLQLDTGDSDYNLGSHRSEVTQHSFSICRNAGEHSERLGRLKHGHAAAVQRAAADTLRGAQQFGLQWEIDDLGDP